MIKSVFIGRILTFLACIIILAAAPQESSGINPSAIADDSLLTDVTAEELQTIIDSYKGKKAVLINIWATWCAPCVEEFPEIVKLQRAYSDQLKVIFVSADFEESRDKALSFLKEQNVDWTTYFKKGKDQQFIESLSDEWTGALPFSKVIGRDGNVVASWEQAADYSKFERHIKTAISH